MMAGSPALRLLSVAVTSALPLTEKDRVVPVTLRRSWVPAARGAVGRSPAGSSYPPAA